MRLRISLSVLAAAALADTLSFLPAVKHDTGALPCAVAAGDFNKDGRLDLVTADNGTRFPFPDRR